MTVSIEELSKKENVYDWMCFYNIYEIAHVDVQYVLFYHGDISSFISMVLCCFYTCTCKYNGTAVFLPIVQSEYFNEIL